MRIQPSFFQWRKNGTNVPNTFGTNTATGANDSTVFLPLTNVTTNDSGTYELFATNAYGTTVSVPAIITVLVPSAPGITADPNSAARFKGGSVTFRVGVNGSEPFSYQWKHGITNLINATNSTLTVSSLQSTEAGTYTVTITNIVGSTNSGPANLTVVVPAPGSYAEAVTTNSPYGYWQLNETSGTTILDSFNGHNGTISDPAPVPGITLGVTVSNVAPRNLPFPGFDAVNTAMGIANDGTLPSRLDAPPLVIDTNKALSFVAWVYAQGPIPNLAGIISARDFAAGYGLVFDGGTQVDPITGATVHQLSYTWPMTTGGGDAVTASGFVSGLTVPTNEWTFVALVLETNQATLYRGYGGTLTAATNDVLTLLADTHAIYDPDTDLATTVMFGRDSAPGEAFWHGARNFRGLIDETAIYNKSLSFSQLEQMYHAGAGDHVQVHANRSAGNVDVNWINGWLLSADVVDGTYTTVDGAISPYHTAPTTNSATYYRVQVEPIHP